VKETKTQQSTEEDIDPRLLAQLDEFTERRIKKIVDDTHGDEIYKEIVLETARRLGVALADGIQRKIAVNYTLQHTKKVGEYMIQVAENPVLRMQLMDVAIRMEKKR